MKQFAAALCLSAAIATSPVAAGSLADPVVTPEIVAADAASGSTKVDGLIIAIWAAMMMAAAGGAL